MIMSLNGCIDMKENPHSYHNILADLLEFAYIWCCSVTMVWVQTRRGKNKYLTALKSNSNTVWFNFQTYIIFSINLVSFKSNVEIQWDRYIVWLSLASRRLYNILYFL